MSRIFDGKKISEEIAKKLAQQIVSLKIPPKLVIIQAGNDQESNTYIRLKKAFAEKIGAIVEHKKYDENVSEQEVLGDIDTYNNDNSVHGIIVQLPLPERLKNSAIVEAVDPQKDVDGLTSENIRCLMSNEPGFMPAATQAVIALLNHEGIDVVGKKAVVVGHSFLVGKPTALALLNRGATVTVCHEYTKNLEEETKRADILIVAVGQPNMITKKFVTNNQVVVDVGITVMPDQKKNSGKSVVGDVNYEDVKNEVQAITPVPGGIGPMTVACLFESVVKACENSLLL